MSPLVFNVALAIGLVLIGAGVGMTSIKDALIVVGGLILILDFLVAFLSLRKG